MSIEQVIAAYLRLRRELILAFASEPWKSCRAGHIQRLSGELGALRTSCNVTSSPTSGLSR